jgi:formamidopyrimidine-DNA glycosylase
MPELPEVETLARSLRPALIGKTIIGSDLRWARTLAAPSPAKFKKQVAGQQILDISRRAKYFDIRLSAFHLIIHLRMSGDLLAVLGGYQPALHDRLILKLTGDTSLVFNDARKFGRLWLTKDPATVFKNLGPEPLSEAFTSKELFTALRSHRRQLKPLLLDQRFLAGLGNIYVDESLHRARLHPLTRSDRVTAKQAERLWFAIRETLEEAIRRNGASIDWVYRGGGFQEQFRVYRRTGEACPVCRAKIRRLVVGQRGTHYCPKCQKLKE